MIAPTAIFAGAILITLRVLIFSAVAVAATASTTYAGPCSDQIDAMQARIDARLEAKAAAGPTAKQGVAAGMSVQPTPRSIAAAEEKLGEFSQLTVAAIGQGMARARAADAAGDANACEKALADVQRAVGP
jgi:mRNA-degrading endonuclease toxin of MazEF toxin-antitoxin module